MANQFDIKLEEQSSQLTQIQLQSPHALLTENMNDAYRVVQGGVIVYLVPVKKGSIERRKRIAELNKGDIFPSYAYRNEAFDVWKFLVVPKSGEAELELLENGSTKPLKRNFIHKCGIPKLEEEGFERCLEEFYLGQSLKDEGFIVHSEIAKKVVSGQTAATIISIAESAEEAPVQGSNTYRVIAQGCKAAGIEVASEARILSCCGAKMAVPDVARISNFTCREVVLEQKWYRQECGVLLGTLDDALVALYRKKGKSYVLYDGEKEVPITAEIAEKISPKAHSIGRALPRTRLTGKDLLRFCKKSIPKKSIVALALLGLAGTLIGILLPTLNQKIYDEYIALGDFGMVIQLCVLIGSFMLGNVFFSMVKKLTEYGVSCHVNYDLQNAVYWRIFQLPESFFRSYDSGDLAQRLGQAGSSAAQVVSQITGAGFGMVFSLFYLWRMIKYSGKLTVWALIMSLVFALLSYFLETRSLRYETLQADTSGKAVAKLYQYLGGVDKIRMAGAEERAILEYLIPFTQEQKYEIQGKRITAVSEVLSDVSTYLFSMILYFVIIKKNQDISVGNFMAFNSAFGTFSSALMQLISGCMTIFRLKPIYTRLKPIFDTQPEDDEQKQIVQSLSGSIELEHVSFGYSPEAGNVLNDISLVQIGAAAFQDCKALTEIDIPEGMQSVGDGAFSGSGLLSATVPAKFQSSVDSFLPEGCEITWFAFEKPEISGEPGDTFFFGRYEQDGDLSNGEEPIEWLILEKNNQHPFNTKRCLETDGCHLAIPSDEFFQKVIVIKPKVLKPEFQLPTRQLYVCTGGFGAYPKSRGSACFCTSLYSGKHTRFEREDILATMDIKAVPQWAQENLRKALSEEKKLNQKKEAAR